MAKIRLAIADAEPSYVSALSNYVANLRRKDLEVSAFTEKCKLQEFLEKAEDGILLVGEAFAEDVTQTDGDKKVVILTEGDPEEEGQNNCIYLAKYQSAERLFKIATEAFVKTPHDVIIGEKGTGAKGIWVYSPSKSRYATPFAYTYCQMLGKSANVLYLNLTENAAFDWMFRDCYSGDLAHAFYLLRQGVSTGEMLGRMICQQDGVDFIAPMQSAWDLAEPSAEEWANFFRRMLRESEYDYVVFDTDSILPGMGLIAEEIYRIFLVTEDDAYEAARKLQFLRTLEGTEDGHVEDVVVSRLRIPYRSEELGKQWLFGELGDLVRNYA